MKILVLNAGSSTQKSRLYDLAGDALPERAPSPLWEAHMDGVRLKVTTAEGTILNEEVNGTPAASISRMLETMWSGTNRVLDSPADIDIVGHRVVHGGRDYRQSTLVTPVSLASSVGPIWHSHLAPPFRLF